MSLSNRMLRVALVALGGLAAAGGIAIAQNAPPPSPGQGGPPSATAAPDATPQTANAEEETASFPVFAVTSVEILRSAHTPSLAVIAVRGLTSSDGWEQGTLVPLTSGNPADG